MAPDAPTDARVPGEAPNVVAGLEHRRRAHEGSPLKALTVIIEPDARLGCSQPAVRAEGIPCRWDARRTTLPRAVRGIGSVAMTEPDFLRDTRASYDAIATDYAERFRDELVARPLDRAMLAGFAELVLARGDGPVADVGCGPGRVTGYLNDLGLPVFGIDLSPEMIAISRRTYPDL